MKIGIIIQPDNYYNNNYLIEYLNKFFDCEKYGNNLQKYDLIICSHLDGGVYRNFITNSLENQKLLLLPIKFTFDYANSKRVYKKSYKINNRIYAGITNHNMVTRVLKKSAYFFNNQFTFPLLKFNFNNIISKKDFYQKYKISEDLQIITFFDHRLVRQWELGRYYQRVKLNRKFIKNFDEIHKLFLKQGYKIIIRTYPGELSPTKDYYKHYENKPLYSEGEDIRAIYKYSSFIIMASGGSLMHSGYLYDRKILYITESDFDWIGNRIYTHYRTTNKKLFEVCKNNLLCGPCCDYSELIENTTEVIEKIKKYNFENIDKNNHVLYRNSYSLNIEEYCELLIEKINSIYNNEKQYYGKK